MKILVVDDEAAVRDICSQALRSAGYDVHTVGSGADALEVLDQNWDIVLTDFAMPGSVDGGKLMWRVQAAGDADVILMTGYPTLDIAVEAVKSGAYDFLIKPFSINTLLLAVKRCLNKREQKPSDSLSRRKSPSSSSPILKISGNAASGKS